MTGISIDFEIDADWTAEACDVAEHSFVTFTDRATGSEVTLRGHSEDLGAFLLLALRRLWLLPGGAKDDAA